jgi:hydrogenase expression/formation protein HypC
VRCSYLENTQYKQTIENVTHSVTYSIYQRSSLMCLAIPGQLININDHPDSLARAGRVNFSGISKDISLAYVPEAKVGDYLIVHAGFALSVLDQEEALASLQAFDDLAEFHLAI